MASSVRFLLLLFLLRVPLLPSSPVASPSRRAVLVPSSPVPSSVLPLPPPSLASASASASVLLLGSFPSSDSSIWLVPPSPPMELERIQSRSVIVVVVVALLESVPLRGSPLVQLVVTSVSMAKPFVECPSSVRHEILLDAVSLVRMDFLQLHRFLRLLLLLLRSCDIPSSFCVCVRASGCSVFQSLSLLSLSLLFLFVSSLSSLFGIKRKTDTHHR